MLKIARPCWIATTRRVTKLRPSRMRSTSKTIGRLGVARTQEVRVERVHGNLGVDGAAGGDERLREHLPAEHADPSLFEAHPAEQVHFEALEIEHVDQIVERGTHNRQPTLPRRRARRGAHRGDERSELLARSEWPRAGYPGS